MRTRIITGLLLAGGAIALLSLAAPFWTYVLLQVASFIAADEFYRMTLGPDRTRERIPGMIIIGAIVAVAWWAPDHILAAFFIGGPLLLSVVLFSDATVEEMGPRAGFMLAGLAYLAFPMVALVFIAAMYKGTLIELALFAAVFAGDSGAFFAGKFLGNKKIYPKISPKKTWAGAYGGATASAIGFWLVAHLGNLHFEIWQALVLGLACGIVGQTGDFAESLFKRSAGIKDSGSLLPGHGGLLDRVDGVLFAAPVLWALMDLGLVG